MFCPKCGTENPAGAMSCARCGNQLAAQQTPQQQSPQQPPSQQQQPYSGYKPPAPQQQYSSYQPAQASQSYVAPVSGQQDYFVHNIVMTVLSFMFCCFGLIPGIIGIVNASKAKSSFQIGDMAGGQQAAKTAKTCFTVNLVLIILAAVVMVAYVIFIIAMGASGHNVLK